MVMYPGEPLGIAEDLGGVFPLQQCACALCSCMQVLGLTRVLHGWMNAHGIRAHCCSECDLGSFLVRNVNARQSIGCF